MALVKTLAPGECIDVFDPDGNPVGRVCLQRTFGKRAKVVLVSPPSHTAQQQVAPFPSGLAPQHVAPSVEDPAPDGQSPRCSL